MIATSNVTRKFGAGYPVNVLRDAMARVGYPGVDLSQLGDVIVATHSAQILRLPM